MSDAQAPPSAGPELAESLRALLRTGLPLPEQATVGRLLELRGVIARAANPRERASRARALDRLLRWQLARFEHPRLAEAARLLFGADRSTEGRSLTERREKAAAAAGYEVHHFRKRIEPEICEHLSRMLGTDSDDLLSRAAPPVLGQARRPMRLPNDVFAWEAAEHEETLSALWAAVYQLRADLLAAARHASMNGPDAAESAAAADQALWRLASVLGAAARYRAAYGPVLLGSDPPTAPEELALLAGWFPVLQERDELALAALAARHPADHDFLAALPTCPVAPAADAWRRALTAASAPNTGEKK